MTLHNGLVAITDDRACDIDMGTVLSETVPEFFGRIGGSDTDFIAKYALLYKLVGPERAVRSLCDHIYTIKEFNGFYDLDDDIESIIEYCHMMIECYESCDQLLVVGHDLLTEFFPSKINTKFHAARSRQRDILRRFCGLVGNIQRPLRLYPYTYVEKFLGGEFTFFRCLPKYIVGKKILVITPFSESIRVNFGNRTGFFRNYEYPEFTILTYNCPITYNGLPRKFYPDRNWVQTVSRIKDGISNIDFDIALLSCGSYAMPIGTYIRDKLNKTAIYVGGCLQLYFGIVGRRYNHEFYLNQINLKHFINPVEWKNYEEYVTVLPETPRDSFGAYF